MIYIYIYIYIVLSIIDDLGGVLQSFGVKNVIEQGSMNLHTKGMGGCEIGEYRALAWST